MSKRNRRIGRASNTIFSPALLRDQRRCLGKFDMTRAPSAPPLEYTELVGADAVTVTELRQIAVKLAAHFGPVAEVVARHTAAEFADVGDFDSSQSWRQIAALCARLPCLE